MTRKTIKAQKRSSSLFVPKMVVSTQMADALVTAAVVLVLCLQCYTPALGAVAAEKARVPDNSGGSDGADAAFGPFDCGGNDSTGIARITVADFLRWTSTPLADGHPLYSVVRIREPWTDVPRDPKTKEDILDAVAKDLCTPNVVTSSEIEPAHFVRIGELVLDTEDSWALVNSIGIHQFPSLIAFGSKWVRAIAPKGGVQHGRVLSVPLPWSPTPESRAALRRQIFASVPTRYYDGVTSMPHDALNFVFSRKEVYQLSALRQLQLQVRNVSVMPAVAFVVRLRLSEKGDAAHLAALSSVAAELGSNAVVHVTEDADVASRFGVTSNRGFAAFAYPFPSDVSLPITPLAAPSAQAAHQERNSAVASDNGISSSPLDLATAILSYFPRAKIHSARPAEQRMATIRSEWQRNVAFLDSHPLRRIDTQIDFDTSVASAKLTIVIFYFLRESDDFFLRHYRSAEEVAAAVHNAWAKGSRLAAIRERVRFEVYWIDAEIHKEAARGFKTASVPSVAFLFGLQDGNRGVRYLFGNGGGGGKKGAAQPSGEFPTAAEVLEFMTGPSLMDASGKGMFSLDLSTIHLTQPDDVAMLRRKLSSSRKLTLSEAPLSTITDWKTYPLSEPKENTFVQDVVEGRITLQEEGSTASRDDDNKKPLSGKKNTASKSKSDAKKQARLERERKKLEAELAEKQRKKEERMRAKAAADEKQRAEEVQKAQEALRKQAKRQQKSHKDGDGDDAVNHDDDGGKDPNKNDDDASLQQQRSRRRRRGSVAGEPLVVPRPKFNAMKGPKNRHEHKKQLEQYRKVMLSERLRTGGGFDRSFEL